MTEQLVKFMWNLARPDNREFRQNSAEFTPQQIVIGVYVPRTKEYIYNAEEIIQAELGNGDMPEPIYTPKAVKFCLDKLGEYLVAYKETASSSDDEVWEETEKSTAPKDKDDEEWEKAIDTDEKWDDTEEDWKE